VKRIGVEVCRRYVIDVDDVVDINDWRGVGTLLADDPTPASEVELLAWDVPDGDLYSRLSDTNYENAYNRRTLEAAAELNAHMALRAQRVL
jgi:hypothetical protein